MFIKAHCSLTYSGIPPELVVTIGSPHDSDSIIVRGAGSSHIDGKVAISAIA